MAVNKGSVPFVIEFKKRKGGGNRKSSNTPHFILPFVELVMFGSAALQSEIGQRAHKQSQKLHETFGPRGKLHPVAPVMAMIPPRPER